MAGACGAPGAGPAAGASAAPPVLTVHVFDPGAALAPVPGIPVALELADGRRVEAVTDVGGAVRVQVDLEAVLAVITHRDGWSFAAAAASRVRRDALGNGSLRLLSSPLRPRNAAPSGVPVSGHILNRAEGSSVVDVSHGAGVDARGLVRAADGGVVVGPGVATYRSVVPAAQPLTLIAVERLARAAAPRVVDQILCGWFVAEAPALTAAATLDIDFAQGVEPTAVSGSVAPPPEASLARAGWLDVRVFAGDVQVGAPSSTLPLSADAGYAFTVEHVGVAIEPVRTRFVVAAPGEVWTLAWRPGPPVAGPNGVAFVAPPRRVAPAGAGPHAWSAPVAWLAEGVEGATVELTYAVDGRAVGVAQASAADAHFALPALPSSSTTLFGAAVEARLGLCVDPDGDGRCDQAAQAAAFVVTAPFAE